MPKPKVVTMPIQPQPELLGDYLDDLQKQQAMLKARIERRQAQLDQALRVEEFMRPYWDADPSLTVGDALERSGLTIEEVLLGKTRN